MSSANHANEITRAIDDHGKEVHYVSAKYTHVEGIGLSEACERALERNGSPTAERQTNLRGHGDRGSGAAHAAKLMRNWQVWKCQRRQHGRAENRSVGSHVRQELYGQP
jgi:hypothetical protein